MQGLRDIQKMKAEVKYMRMRTRGQAQCMKATQSNGRNDNDKQGQARRLGK